MPDDEVDDRGTDLLSLLAEHLEKCGGVALTFTHGDFVVGSEWGQEAPDSDMAGGAAYGADPRLEVALFQMLEHHVR